MMFEEEKSQSSNHLETSLRAMVTQASRQNLLPKIMWKADKEFGSKKLLQYQKSVKRQYEKDLKAPLKYDPEQAKSERQKFREKVIKLVNNQLEVDYFENIKQRDGHAVAFRAHQKEESQMPTKKEFQIFRNFNEKRFKETYANLFDDKLELTHNVVYRNSANKSKKRCHTLHLLDKPKITPIYIKTQASQPINNKVKQHELFLSTPTPRTERKKKDISISGLDSGRKRAAVLFNEKKTVGKEIPYDQQTHVISIFKRIGGFSPHHQPMNFSLTRESINRWLKDLYQKVHRIIDFLELKNVVSLQQFWEVSKRLRVMPQQHLLFMVFLYYDGNNDGYICDYDLQRVTQLGVKRPILIHDFNKMKQSNIKKKLSKKEPYLDLYRLSEITESVYFQWKNKKETGSSYDLQLQMKNRLLSSKQKQIFLDFPSFCSVYKYQKPFLWYDLLYAFSGVRFQGLRYD